jgi:uncharacterized protein YqhQ
METRELYKQKYEAQIREWSAKLEALAAHADKLTAQAKIDAKPHLDGISTKLEAAKAKLHELAAATDDKWEDAKKSADHVWSDLKASLEGAHDIVKPDPKTESKKEA